LNVSEITMSLQQQTETAPAVLLFGDVVRDYCGNIETVTLYAAVIILFASFLQWTVISKIDEEIYLNLPWKVNLKETLLSISDGLIFFCSAWIFALFWYKRAVPSWIIWTGGTLLFFTITGRIIKIYRNRREIWTDIKKALKGFKE